MPRNMKTPLANRRSTFISAALIRRLSSDLSSYSLSFVSVSMPRSSSRSLAHETREGPFIPAIARPARCLVVQAVLSRQSRARNAISMGFFWGLVSKPPLYRRERSPPLDSVGPLPPFQSTRSVVHRDVRLQPTTTTTMTMTTAVAATRVYECSASGIVFLYLLSFSFSFSFRERGYVRFVR